MPQILPEVTPSELRELKKLFKGHSSPSSVSVTPSVDSEGDDALDVILVFPDKTPDIDLRWKNVSEALDYIRNLIWEKDGGRRYVYPRVRRRKELSNQL